MKSFLNDVNSSDSRFDKYNINAKLKNQNFNTRLNSNVPISSSQPLSSDQLRVPDSPSLVRVRTWYTVAKQGVSC